MPPPPPLRQVLWPHIKDVSDKYEMLEYVANSGKMLRGGGDSSDDEDYVDELPKVLKAEQRTKRMSVFAEPMDEKVRAPRRACARPAASERARP